MCLSNYSNNQSFQSSLPGSLFWENNIKNTHPSYFSTNNYLANMQNLNNKGFNFDNFNNIDNNNNNKSNGSFNLFGNNGNCCGSSNTCEEEEEDDDDECDEDEDLNHNNLDNISDQASLIDPPDDHVKLFFQITILDIYLLKAITIIKIIKIILI